MAKISDLAKEAFAKGDYALAVDLYKQCIQDDAYNSPDMFMGYGDALACTGRIELSFDAYAHIHQQFGYSVPLDRLHHLSLALLNSVTASVLSQQNRSHLNSASNVQRSISVTNGSVISDPLCCALCDDILKCPVTTLCGHTFCGECCYGQTECKICGKVFSTFADSFKQDVLVMRLVEKWWSPESNDRAINYMQRNTLDEALKSCNESLEKCPNNYQGLLLRSEVLYRLSHFKSSLADADNALKSRPTSYKNLWLKNKKLYWPPGKNVDRRTTSSPQENWLQFEYKLLKGSIETFEEALELEQRYSKHRDSNSFREYQQQQKMKRLHPVNYADQSNCDLIDVNDLIKGINAGISENAKFVDCAPSQAHKYHENCLAEADTARTVKKPVAKAVNSSANLKSRTGKGSLHAAKKIVKKPLPFQKNYLKSGVSKANNRVVPNLTKPKLPRYDNFLQSGMRSNGLTAKVKAKNVVPSATITKAQHLKQIGETNGIDFDDENEVPAHTNFVRESTPVETQGFNRQKNYNSSSDVGDFLNVSRSSAERFQISNRNELSNENVPTTKDSPIRSALSQNGMSFEERVLMELSNLKKNQESFETRIERKIETFCNDQSRIHGNGQSRFQSNAQSRSQGNGQSRMQGQSGIQYQSRQYGGTRNDLQPRHREPVSPQQYVDDFEDFEELDKHFPVHIKSNVEKLEFNIRKDLEFKFLLNSRLNELGGNDYKKCIRLKMKYLFTDPVLERYTWNGTSNEDEQKDAFKKFKALNNLLLHSVRDRCAKTKRDEYQDYMVQWLKHAKSRQRIVTYTYPERQNRDDSYDDDDEH